MEETNFLSSEQGFSLVELLIVIVIISILTTIAVLGTASTKLFAADNQALAITDILQEARQKALTERKTLRVELNDTKKQIRLIDENNTTSTAADDKIIRSSSFDPATSVGTKPANIDPVYSVLPQSGSPVPEMQYTQTNYLLSQNDQVKTLRFTKTGEVVDGGTDNLGTGAINTGATIYVYNGASGSKSSIVRAITLSGITAAAQLFKCQTNAQGICTSWAK
ncbi:MAG: prepilin-type N-terminal cleavage/methylation domain-containing protein [Acidobacteriota bacterium]|nr:prepilin-type N-terminal cleavage/methylation domain-containing protein [Acidobacteriota bacterium]